MEYVSITNKEALQSSRGLCHMEDIIPASESSYALVYMCELAPMLLKDKILLANLSGRSDRGMRIVAEVFSIQL